MIKNLPANAGDIRDASSIPDSGRSLAEERATHSVPGESHGQRSLEGYMRRAQHHFLPNCKAFSLNYGGKIKQTQIERHLIKQLTID